MIGDVADTIRGAWRAEHIEPTTGPEGQLALTPIVDRKSARLGTGRYTLSYARNGADGLRLSGVIDGDTLVATLTRVPDTSFPLHYPSWW